MYYNENNHGVHFEIVPNLIFCTSLNIFHFFYIAHFLCIRYKAVQVDNPVTILMYSFIPAKEGKIPIQAVNACEQI